MQKLSRYRFWIVTDERFEDWSWTHVNTCTKRQAYSEANKMMQRYDLGRVIAIRPCPYIVPAKLRRLDMLPKTY